MILQRVIDEWNLITPAVIYPTASEAFNLAVSVESYPNILKISSVCSPIPGAFRVIFVFVLDSLMGVFSTSMVAARGRVNVAAARGEPIPEGWCTDAQGRPTTDPYEALKGFVLPIAGPKGYALTTVIGMLSTMLSGGAFGTDVTHLYDDFKRPQNIGHLLGVLPVGSFVDCTEFKQRMDKGIREIKGVKKAPGVTEIFLPGEREHRTLLERRKSGIPLAVGTVGELQELSEEFGVPLRLI